jgi:rhodanese-related sulfurtransferase
MEGNEARERGLRVLISRIHAIRRKKSQAIVPQESTRERVGKPSTKPAQGGHYAHHASANQLPAVFPARLNYRLYFPAESGMSNDPVENILARAKQRGEAMKLPYAGALLPSEAHALTRQVPGAKLVDVRTQAEWEYVGHVPGSVLVEWNTYPDGERNPQFIEELQAQVSKTDSPVMFLCRSGARSHHAAAMATLAGYPNSYNILEGFEGDRDAQGHRSSVGGWRFAGLPWAQG